MCVCVLCLLGVRKLCVCLLGVRKRFRDTPPPQYIDHNNHKKRDPTFIATVFPRLSKAGITRITGSQHPSSNVKNPLQPVRTATWLELSRHAMPKVLIFKAQDIMRCDSFWLFVCLLWPRKVATPDGCLLLSMRHNFS